MEEKSKTSKFSMLDLIFPVGLGTFIFGVVKYGGVASTPPYFIITYFALSWISEIGYAVRDIVRIIREEQQTVSQGITLKRTVRRVLMRWIPLAFKTLSIFSVLRMLELLSQL